MNILNILMVIILRPHVLILSIAIILSVQGVQTTGQTPRGIPFIQKNPLWSILNFEHSTRYKVLKHSSMIEITLTFY